MMNRRLILLTVLLLLMNFGLSRHYAVGDTQNDEGMTGKSPTSGSVQITRQLGEGVWSDKEQSRDSGGYSSADMNMVNLAISNVTTEATLDNKTGLEEVDHAAIYRDLSLGQRVEATFRQDAYIKPDTPTVYLSFDDGPSSLTPQVLELLREEGVQATFFVLGQLAQREQETVKRIVAEGHAIGNHTYDHHYQKIYGGSFKQFFTQVEETDETIYQITGQRTPLFRAPGGTHGNFDPYYFYYMEQAGYQVYDWNVDAGDSRRKNVPAKEIVANVKDAPLKHEMHVLLHDSAGHEESLKALPEIIRYFKNLGYRFAPLSEQVEPVIFSMGKLKWDRSITPQDHMAYTEMVMEFRRERAAAIGHNYAEKQNERLVIHSEGRKTILDRSDYELMDGRFYVALDQLATALGGKVVSNSLEDYHYRASINGHELTYLPVERTIRVETNKQTYQSSNIQMIIHRDGRLFVPLRATIELAAGSIPAYSLEGAEKEVYVHMETGTNSMRMMIARVFHYFL